MDPRITYFPVSNGDCSLITLSDNTQIIIDCNTTAEASDEDDPSRYDVHHHLLEGLQHDAGVVPFGQLRVDLFAERGMDEEAEVLLALRVDDIDVVAGRDDDVILQPEAVAFFARIAGTRAKDEPLLARADGEVWGASHQVRPMKRALSRAGAGSEWDLLRSAPIPTSRARSRRACR